MLNNQSLSQLRELNLLGMLRVLELQSTQKDIAKLTFDERLGILLNAELTDRENRRIVRLQKVAKLRQGKACIEDIDYSPGRKLNQSLILGLSDCNWINNHHNLIITGATGTGKSWIACAFGNQACRRNFSTYYTTATQLFEDLSIAQLDGSLPRFRNFLTRMQLLIIDDLGIGGINNTLGPILLEIIDQQSAKGALLITSQYPTAKWYDLFSDPTVADAILDRIVHQSQIIKLHGESMRKTKAKNV